MQKIHKIYWQVFEKTVGKQRTEGLTDESETLWAPASSGSLKTYLIFHDGLALFSIF